MVKSAGYLSNFPVRSSELRPTQMMRPSTMIEICFQEKYFDFTGRASRSEFGLFCLLSTFLGVLINAVIISIGGFFEKWGGVVSYSLVGIITLIFLIPFVAVSARRLHDVGKSGWYLLFILLPIIGWYFLITAYTTEGSDFKNAYGKVPVNDN